MISHIVLAFQAHAILIISERLTQKIVPENMLQPIQVKYFSSFLEESNR